MLEGLKFGELLNSSDWQILIWRICGHVPLSMCLKWLKIADLNFGKLLLRCQIHQI